MTTKDQINAARIALKNARTNEQRAGIERQARRITKSCHREAVRVRVDAEQRLAALEA